MFFSLSSWELGLILLAVVGGFTVAGLSLGRYLRRHVDTLREPLGALRESLRASIELPPAAHP